MDWTWWQWVLAVVGGLVLTPVLLYCWWRALKWLFRVFLRILTAVMVLASLGVTLVIILFIIGLCVR